VLVTGGNGGIGLGMARACGLAGAQIVIWGRNDGKNAEAIEVLHADGITAHGFSGDVDDEAAIESTFAASIAAAGGRIDSVFANACRNGPGTRFVDTSLADWQAVMRTNVDGVFLTFRTAARHMIAAGGGSLVAISSSSVLGGVPCR
jgi:NAD(P)-dependent dehydrogenase (short-subunit alcohol dehydrogenase family)